jgi:hypothetical protein
MGGSSHFKRCYTLYNNIGMAREAGQGVVTDDEMTPAAPA